jgi:AcrR family transcriptional regulator
MSPEVDRRTVIADAAISIVSERGVRALTHRAIDEHARLPAGSTSYYLRTRHALLTAVVQRLAERTAADLRSVPAAEARADHDPGADHDPDADHDPGAPARGRQTADPAAALDTLAEAAGRVLDRMIGDRRADSLARYALTLELAADPELHRLLAAGQPLRDIAAGTLLRLGAQDPATDAADLVSYADGLVFDRLVGARSLDGPAPGSAESVRELTRAVRTFLRGVFGC